MWLISLVLGACLVTGPEAYFFEDGYSHHYTYWAETSVFGHKNFTTILKFQVNPVNTTENGNRLHSLKVESFVQFVKGGMLVENPMKWDISKIFLFSTNENGNIALVHCHSEDHEELVLIKKALVSIFSVHVQLPDENDAREYNVTETDHLGTLQHSYTVKRTQIGIILDRHHSSTERVHRLHTKNVHYDHYGTLQTAIARDRIVLRNKENTEMQMNGDKAPQETHNRHIVISERIPDIDTGAIMKVRLDGKRRATPPVGMFHNLTSEILPLKQEDVKEPLSKLQVNLTNSFACIQQHAENNLNKSKCVDELQFALSRMHTGDYRDTVNSILGQQCRQNVSFCQAKRLMVLDVVAGIGDIESQRILVKHVLSRIPPVEEELRRVLIHCVHMEHPIQEFIHAVENLCFGKHGEYHGARAMSTIQGRACLAFGSLTRHEAKRGNSIGANKMVSKLETWLEDHGKEDHHGHKRDTSEDDRVDDDHHVSKAILLHSLGNAAIPRSTQQLVLYAQPNKGHPMWRRAALDALRNYTCELSAKALMNTILHDDNDSIRKKAFSIFATHPRRQDAVTNEENEILRMNYTYPTLARVKRDLMETIAGNVLFEKRIGHEPKNYPFHIGCDDIGGSFGMLIENGISVISRILRSYNDISFDNKIWIEVNIGLLNINVDLFKLEVCYQGRMVYNQNMFKDFNLDFFKNTPEEYGQMVPDLIAPLVKTANSLALLYQDPLKNTTISGFGPLSEAVRKIPEISEAAITSALALNNAAKRVGGKPFMRKLQQLTGRAQAIVEDIRNEAIELFTVRH